MHDADLRENTNTPPPEKGRDLLRKWFDAAEQQLTAEAQRAGIFQNPSMTGSTREEVFRKALQQVLPPAVEIGKGKVIGAACEPSQQIDIVIFDGRFPVLRQGAEALYPIEGVIATIEVKSLLSGYELRRALDNSFSVMRISPSFVKEDADTWIERRRSAGAGAEQAMEELIWQLMPRTYVFAFDGMRSMDSQTESLHNCLLTDLPATPSRPLIPSVIAGGRAVTVALGDPFHVQTRDPSQREQVERFGVAFTFESPTRFGILVSHLLWHLEQRTLMLEPPGTIRRSVESYLPFVEYINDCIRDRMFSVTLWHQRKSWVIRPDTSRP